MGYQNQPDSLLHAFELCTRMEKQYPDSYLKATLLYYLLQIQEALEPDSLKLYPVMEKLLLNDCTPATYNKVARICINNNIALNEAKDHVKKAIKLENKLISTIHSEKYKLHHQSKREQYRLTLALAHIQLKEYQEAKLCLNEIIHDLQVLPDRAFGLFGADNRKRLIWEALSNLSHVYQKLGEIQEYVKTAEKTFVLKPRDEATFNLLWDAYLVYFGTEAKARKAYSRFLRRISEDRDSKLKGSNGYGKIPDVTLTDLIGKNVYLKDFIGKVLIINFWSSWCGPCINELPYLQKILDEMGNNQIVVIAVNISEVDEMIRVQQYIEEQNFTFVTLIGNWEVADKFGATVVPATYIIDASGTIRYQHFGFDETSGFFNELRMHIRGLTQHDH